MTKAEQMIQDIEKNGVACKGNREMLKHLQGERLTIRQMAIGKCYDCMGFYSDGRGQDCEIATCPLYPIMPYRKQGEKYSSGHTGRKGFVLTDEQKEKMAAGKRLKSAS